MEASIENYGNAKGQRYTFKFYNTNGIEFVNTDGTEHHLGGTYAQPLEQGVEYPVVIRNATFVEVTDIIVSADVNCRFTVTHIGTGAITSGNIKVEKSNNP